MAGPPLPAIKPLGQVKLGVAMTDIVVTPTGVQPNSMSEVWVLWIANTDTVNRTLSLRYGPAGALISPDNSLGENWVIPPGKTWEIDGGSGFICILRAGDHLAGLCDVANKVTITAFGQETSN